ncbi:MAG: bifunctional (p)ppGpp synthetase/guanosine-3',5'-bis(diphosphate) 3'-pyrophosphohydrolase [Campylobacterales bacterium]|nr:bifunctional (p)ppGpp synthetase/guanosine-3',5'-bis(diphosphate) 3'-pyrophosphohydrolase [Campylobacterales bacterium]
MQIWNQDRYTKAWNFACEAHLNQTMPNSNLPYIKHVANVMMEAMGALVNGNNVANPNLLIEAALLHDTLEDTPTTYDDILALFGKNVAQGVKALSKDPTMPSEEQMTDSIKRIQTQPKEIWMVKLADESRICKNHPLIGISTAFDATEMKRR